MRIGIPKEIKEHEYRVGMTPAGVRELCRRGHQVLVEAQAGVGAGFSDQDYRAAGAEIVAFAPTLYRECELIVKVKEPQPQECDWLRPGQILFAFLHLAAAPELAQRLIDTGVVAIAYETVMDKEGRLPLLAPMSEVAGRMAVQVGAHHLERPQGGRGVLLSGVAGVAPGKVVIIGGGTVGANAARIAVALGAEVVVLERAYARLQWFDQLFGGRVKALYATPEAIENHLTTADLVIGAVYVPGAATPKLISRAMVARMPAGSVLVDVAIDQGGCAETSRPTTHGAPTYVAEGVIHYCVTNMPGACARTSTCALTHATFPYVLALAEEGWEAALDKERGFAAGLHIAHGRIRHAAVAAAVGQPYAPWGPASQESV
ncbi:MAG: alanine dehydrogenase [Rhodocyclaceae bacterium]|nr:alanine dehydrogenase [Rhodocyclaceae bacterium]